MNQAYIEFIPYTNKDTGVRGIVPAERVMLVPLATDVNRRMAIGRE